MDEQVVKAQSLDFGELDAMKESLGEILLALQCPLTAKEQQELWQCFESLLAQYAERRIVK